MVAILEVCLEVRLSQGRVAIIGRPEPVEAFNVSNDRGGDITATKSPKDLGSVTVGCNVRASNPTDSVCSRPIEVQ
jgi:hypothetical protein